MSTFQRENGMNDKWKSLMEKLAKKKFWKVSKKSNKVKWRISFCLNLTRNKVPRKEKLQLPFSQIYISNFYCTCEMCEKSPFHTMNNLNVPIQCNPYLFQLGRINNSPICYSIFSIDFSTMQDIVAALHN